MKLTRVCSTSKGTFGVLSENGVPLCLTCEEPWKANQRLVSCIPTGIYKVISRFSVKHKNHWHIQNVPGRDLILIHAGNTINDVEGCIIVGRSFGLSAGLPAVMQSQEAMQILREKLPDTFDLEITGA